MHRAAASLAVALLCLSPASGLRAQLAADPVGRSERLPDPPGSHWALVLDQLMLRLALVDLDSQRFLGMVSTGYLSSPALFSTARPEFYLVDTYMSRGTHGERSDVVTIYDRQTLGVSGEIVIPAHRALNAVPAGNAALSDDDRFLAVFNQDPATSLSIVDLAERRFAGEIPTAGCGCVYAAGPRRFVSLCADGALLSVELDERGAARKLTRSQPFFDPQQDPVTEKGVRVGDTWLFASYAGVLHPVDLSGAEPRFPEPWSLLSDADRQDRWRVGGNVHLAAHAESGRLFSLVHQGENHSHKQPGSEVWVYDLAAHRRLERIRLVSPGFAFLGNPLEFGQSWIWPLNRIYPLLRGMIPPETSNIGVTQDAEPLVLATSDYSGSVGVYDPANGELLRVVHTGNITSGVIYAPFGGRP